MDLITVWFCSPASSAQGIEVIGCPAISRRPCLILTAFGFLIRNPGTGSCPALAPPLAHLCQTCLQRWACWWLKILGWIFACDSDPQSHQSGGACFWSLKNVLLVDLLVCQMFQSRETSHGVWSGVPVTRVFCWLWSRLGNVLIKRWGRCDLFGICTCDGY